MSLSRRQIIGGIIAVIVSISLLTVCDDREPEAAKKTPEQREAQLQAQLQAEHAQKLEALQAARDAQISRDSWITAVASGACAACLMVLLVGIHIGSRALARYRKENLHG